MTPEICPARAAHIPSILEIWNHVIRDTAYTFTSTLKTVEDVEHILTDQCALVMVEGARVIGFARFGPFRGGDGYRFIAEHTILMASSARARGLGPRLLSALEDEGRKAGIARFVAGIGGENDIAQKFHKSMGYTETGRMPRMGWKFERWHDLVLMQKDL